MGKYSKINKILEKKCFTLKIFRKHNTLNWPLKKIRNSLRKFPRKHQERERNEIEVRDRSSCNSFFIFWKLYKILYKVNKNRKLKISFIQSLLLSTDEIRKIIIIQYAFYDVIKYKFALYLKYSIRKINIVYQKFSILYTAFFLSNSKWNLSLEFIVKSFIARWLF